MDLHTNSSNNTVFADADGNIAYFHANFVPKRDPRFDWERPVDGSDPATEWQGHPHGGREPAHQNPSTGWLQNTNNWPYSASARRARSQQDYPTYMDYFGENPRGIHAVRVLSPRTNFTLDSLIAAAYDTELTAFEPLLPVLFRDYDALPAPSPLKAAAGRADRRCCVAGIIATRSSRRPRRWRSTGARTSGARRVRRRPEARVSTYDFMETQADAGHARSRRSRRRWTRSPRTSARGRRRGARSTASSASPATSCSRSATRRRALPVAFTSSRWGSLASFGARTFNGTKRLYGTSGNSFVAVVEFGPRVRAKAVVAGGQSGDPASPHFNDQAERYATGEFRDVYFYPEDLAPKARREYRPGL